MSYVEEILEFNQKFVEEKQYEDFLSTKLPDKKIAILSCMDTRLTALLPAALNFKNGDIKMIKNAGAVVSHPFGSVMRSLLVAIYELGVEEIMVIGHHDCGMQGLNPEKLIEKMVARGVEPEQVDLIQYVGIDLQHWLRGFEDTETSVSETVNIVRKHPLMPKDVAVYGFVIDPVTGKLSWVDVPELEIGQ